MISSRLQVHHFERASRVGRRGSPPLLPRAAPRDGRRKQEEVPPPAQVTGAVPRFGGARARESWGTSC